MATANNCYLKIWKREHSLLSNVSVQRSCHVTDRLIKRLGLEAELQGHNGCVNCLEWNESGSMLASGSDDIHIALWDPHKHKLIHKIQTNHMGNIFTVKFLPQSNDNVIISGAADHKIFVHDVQKEGATQTFTCHIGRVKRLATAPAIPHMFWSASEDGTVMQFDLRDPASCSPRHPENVLINLNAYIGDTAEVKCISINPRRSEQIAVGANDQYVRLYDRRMLSCHTINFPIDASTTTTRQSASDYNSVFKQILLPENFPVPRNAVQYYVPGHLSAQLAKQRLARRYRSLASTYVTFNPDGAELLANLGGEQIYLFDVNQSRERVKFNFPADVVSSASSCAAALSTSSNGVVKDPSTTNGLNGTSNGISKLLPTTHPAELNNTQHQKDKKVTRKSEALAPVVTVLKQKANSLYEQGKYSQAVVVYNQAISLGTHSPQLYCNRAAAYMKRAWDGDLYAALRDCHTAIELDSEYMKAYFRLCRCLCDLKWLLEAKECSQLFKRRFPSQAESKAFLSLLKDIAKAEEGKDKNDKEDSDFNRSQDEERAANEHEKEWCEEAYDYISRYCGHCNTTTDIKEANYFGSNSQYIVAGSDDGSFFIWDKITSNLVRVLHGDESIVNCLQPHPSTCLLATSGIESVVRLWSPRAEDGEKDGRVIDDSDDAAMANQRRMNADPLEVMLMNMGYQVDVMQDVMQGLMQGEGSDRDGGDAPTACRPS